MQIIVINLHSAIERKEFQEKQLKKLGLEYSFLKATSVKDIDDTTYQKHYFDWQRPLRRSEVACYFSHRRCWQKVIDSDRPALIIEDDALLSFKVPSILLKLENSNHFDLVDLEVTGRKKNVSKSTELLYKNNKLLRLYLNSSGAGGYILYPSGAKKLMLHEKQKGISLADAHIANCNSLRAYQVEPAAIVQLILCPYYQINNPDFVKFQTSETNAELKVEHQEFSFRIKKLVNEVKLGLIKLKLLFVSKRRLICLENSDFKEK